MKISNIKKKDIIKKFGRHDKDTGSPEVQISLLTQRINLLTEHLKKEEKDFHSRRGLEIMVSRRKKLLNYLRRKDFKGFNKIKKELGWQPKVKFAEGLEKTIDWYCNNQKWWKDILSGCYRQFYELHYKDRK